MCNKIVIHFDDESTYEIGEHKEITFNGKPYFSNFIDIDQATPADPDDCSKEIHVWFSDN